MAEKGQQHELHSYRARQLRFAQLLRLIANMQREDSSQGMIVKGVGGIGKSIGVVTYLRFEKQ